MVGVTDGYNHFEIEPSEAQPGKVALLIQLTLDALIVNPDGNSVSFDAIQPGVRVVVRKGEGDLIGFQAEEIQILSAETVK